MENRRTEVLHITAHLGGGVGKALSGLTLNTPCNSPVRHTIICLERPEKSQFSEKIKAAGCDVIVCPSHVELCSLIEGADIVQLEWWNHPATIGMLCSAPLPPMRLVLWCHISGLHNPIIPCRLMEAAHKCLFTSPCSYEASEVTSLLPFCRNRFDVVHSSGGFDGLTPPPRDPSAPLVAGYLGSLNFAKLHPRYVDFLAAVAIPEFSVRMIGDATNKEILERQCQQAGRRGMLEFYGYRTDIASELASINVLAYLLNPRHYGTSENALLEAMAMGVIPIVLDNPAERSLVTDRETGLIVASPREFADAVAWLQDHPDARQRIGQQAAASVRDRFSTERMTSAFERHYSSLLAENKTPIPFREVFGITPAEWFLSCQKDQDAFLTEGAIGTIDDLSLPGLLERTKGSIFHFRQHFPEDARLSQWAMRLESFA